MGGRARWHWCPARPARELQVWVEGAQGGEGWAATLASPAAPQVHKPLGAL